MAECDTTDCGAAIDDFVRTGRTGRRNALPDVLARGQTTVTTAGLPEVLENFSIGSSTQAIHGTQSSQAQPPAEKME